MIQQLAKGKTAGISCWKAVTELCLGVPFLMTPSRAKVSAKFEISSGCFLQVRRLNQETFGDFPQETFGCISKQLAPVKEEEKVICCSASHTASSISETVFVNNSITGK